MFGIIEEKKGKGEGQGRLPPPFHYLRARVQLAFIEGQIYDKLYSVRSLKETPERRRQQVARLDALLDTWRRSSLPLRHSFHQEGQFVGEDTPQEPTDGAAAEDSNNNLTATLNHTYLFCLFTLHGLYSRDSVWLRNIDILSRTALEHFSNKSERCMHSLQVSPFPGRRISCDTKRSCESKTFDDPAF